MCRVNRDVKYGIVSDNIVVFYRRTYVCYVASRCLVLRLGGAQLSRLLLYRLDEITNAITDWSLLKLIWKVVVEVIAVRVYQH